MSDGAEAEVYGATVEHRESGEPYTLEVKVRVPMVCGEKDRVTVTVGFSVVDGRVDSFDGLAVKTQGVSSVGLETGLLAANLAARWIDRCYGGASGAVKTTAWIGERAFDKAGEALPDG